MGVSQARPPPSGICSGEARPGQPLSSLGLRREVLRPAKCFLPRRGCRLPRLSVGRLVSPWVRTGRVAYGQTRTSLEVPSLWFSEPLSGCVQQVGWEVSASTLLLNGVRQIGMAFVQVRRALDCAQQQAGKVICALASCARGVCTSRQGRFSMHQLLMNRECAPAGRDGSLCTSLVHVECAQQVGRALCAPAFGAR